MPDNLRGDGQHAAGERILLGFGGHASAGDHIGHFYRTKAEWKALLVPFLKSGLEAGDKCVYLMSLDAGWQDIRNALADAGIDVEDAMALGQLVVEEGRATPEELRRSLDDAIAEVQQDFQLLRWAGDMTWSLAEMPTSESLMEWETMCNVIEGPPAVFLCQYDLTRFPGSVVLDALRTHPLCVIGNAIHHNPFYQEPEVFLEELRSRGETRQAL